MSSPRDHKTYKNLPNTDGHEDLSISIESDDDDGDDTLNLMSHNLSFIPQTFLSTRAPFVTTLILTNNALRSLQSIKHFTNLRSLQLDRNKLNNIKHLPKLTKLKTLWLNNNHLTDLTSLLYTLKKQTPHLEYLSLLCNPLCPEFNESEYQQHHESYRLKIIKYLPKLQLLDTQSISMNEREQSTEMDGYISQSYNNSETETQTQTQTETQSLNTDIIYNRLLSDCAVSDIDRRLLNHGGMRDIIMPSSDTERCDEKKTSFRNRNRNRNRNKKDKKVRYEIRGETFRVYAYYKPIKIVGSGAYGVVCSAIDERNGKKVAIKKCKYIFDRIKEAQNTLREIKLLSYFTSHQCSADIIEIYDCISPTMEEIDTFQDIYFVMPYFDRTLLDIIDSKQTLSHLHFQYIIYQILRGLKCVHASDVIHRDIKPENILINARDCKIKIIDFGTSRDVHSVDDASNTHITEYVCTRWYRAPEVMCNAGHYDKKMDIWSVGCILAEMILRKPLFPGRNYVDQLQRIFKMMNASDDTSMEWISNENAKHWIHNHLQKKSDHLEMQSLTEMLLETFNDDNESDNFQCIDLLHRLLALDPKCRLSAKDALYHPYFKMYFDNVHHNHKAFELSIPCEKQMTTKFGLRHLIQSELHKIHQKRWKKIMRKMRSANKEREYRLSAFRTESGL